MKRLTRRLFLVSIVASIAVAACGGVGGGDKDESGGSLTLYSGRAEALVAPLIAQFEKETGIDVGVKYADSAPLAATLLEEGNRSPADVFWSQDPGPLGAVSGLLKKLPETTLSKVDARFRAHDGAWVGVSGRARVVAYNPNRVPEAQLPASILDFTDPKWKGRIGWAPTNASLQAMVTSIRLLKGEDVAKRWLEGVKANEPKVYGNNTAVVNAVGAGEVDVGFVNHYYLYAIKRTNPNVSVRNYHLKAGDPGAIVFAAGAGILATSKNAQAAQRFIDYLLSPAAQQYFATETFEYPLTGSVITVPELTPLDGIQAPSIDLSRLSDVQGTLKLMRDTGVIP